MIETYADIDLASFIDHSLLNPVATPEQIAQCCAEADRFGFPTVCVYPAHVRQAVELLHQKQPQVCTVIGFPGGATTSAVKLYEAQDAVDNGATELDVVLNLGWLKTGRLDEVHRECAAIVEATNCVVKAVLETYLLSDEEKALAAEICLDTGVAFLQTNTGFYGSASSADVKLFKEASKNRLEIKAASGIQTLDQAMELILAGATRLGTSYGPALVRQRDTLDKGSSLIDE
jgi:deoxyribose-phosphate aldolase